MNHAEVVGRTSCMSQSTSSSEPFPTAGVVPLDPEDAELFIDAMMRIIRRLDEPATGTRGGELPVPHGDESD
jgi:hypothetical protein